MEKIKKLFKSAAHKLGGLKKPIEKIWKPIRAQIFWKKEEAKKKKIIMVIVWVVILAILGTGLWFGIARLINKAQESALTVSGTTVTAKATIITSKNCTGKCWDTALFIAALENKGVKIERTTTLVVDSWLPFGRGAALAKQYEITKVPTVILEFTGDNKPDLSKFFSASLGKVYDDVFVLSKILAPYYDTAEKKIKGVVNVTYLSDKTCAECYDVKLHETALKNLGVDTSNSQQIDISSDAGKALIAKYNITKVPTVIITGEVSEYSTFVETWASVGTVAGDGAYVFTNMDTMGGSYKDLKTGKIIKAKAAATTK